MNLLRYLTATILAVFAAAANAAPPFSLNEGTVVFEAEDFSTNISPRSAHQWIFTNNVAGYSSNGFMEATPDNGLVFTNWPVTSPELQFPVNFPSAGTYRVWIRGYASNPSNDSVHWGLDGTTNATGLSWTMYDEWHWTNNTAGAPATVSPGSAGLHTLNIWIREDGARLDRVAVTANTNFQPRIGNAWHIPDNMETNVIASMRLPFGAIFSNTAVTIYNGNQFAGGANGANQLSVGSSIFYRNATNSTWTELPMTFHAQSGNNKYFKGTIPANTFRAGDEVQYYLRIMYSDRLPTYLYQNNGTAVETEIESVAKASPYFYFVQATPSAGYPSPADWRDESIYMLMTDRYYDGDPTNNDLHPEEPARYDNPLGIHGGDFKGLQAKLDYIKALGSTAIWITPVFVTAGTNTGYHGYTAQSFYEFAPNLGGLAALTNMIAAAHQRGLRIILDIVCNHQGNRIDSADQQWTNVYKAAGYAPRWTIATNMYPAPFNQLTNYHNNGHIADYNNDTQVELGELRGLDDLRTETLYVRTNMLDIYDRILAETDVDAFRLDALKHVEIGFWQLFNPEMRTYAAAMGKTNFFQYGESVSGDAKNGSYTGTKLGAAFCNDSVLDFGLYSSINSVFIFGGSTKQIEDHYNAISNNYDPAAWYRLVTFIDNHDKTRFMNPGTANTNKLNVALNFLYTSRGIPCLYYGTEQNFNGANLGSGSLPTNREDMFSGQFEVGPSIGDNFDESHGTFQQVAKLNNFRRLYPSLRTGSHFNLWNTSSGAGLFAYERRLGAEEVVVVFNTASAQQTLTYRATSYPAGTTLVNLFDTNEFITVVAGSTGLPPITVSGNSTKMFIAASLLEPLDPVVISQTPHHAATNINVTSSFVLRFSKPMDTNSVQSSLVMTPSVSGSFAWTAGREQMTFTPAGPGFPGLTSIVVRLGTNAMDMVSSNKFYAPFDTYFKTAASSVTDTVPPVVSITQPPADSVLQGTVNVSGLATDNVSVLNVEVRIDNDNWTPATGTTSWTGTFNTANYPNGSHIFYARSRDSSANLSGEAAVSVRFFNVPPSYEQRISAGNPNDVTNCDGRVWVADRAYALDSFGFSDGASGFVNNAISGVCVEAQSLYQRERFGASTSAFDYIFDCPNGQYEVTLLEAETFATAPSQRVFNLYSSGVQLLTNFDIIAAAGGMNTPIAVVVPGAVTNGHLALNFLPQAGDPRVSGIQVIKSGDIDSDSDGIPDWWMLGYFDHPSGEDADQSQAGDDADGDGVINLGEYLAGTDPVDDTSFPRVENISLAGSPSVRFYSVSGRTYTVEFTDATPSNDWDAMSSSYPGTNGWISVVDTNQALQRFYRLRINKP